VSSKPLVAIKLDNAMAIKLAAATEEVAKAKKVVNAKTKEIKMMIRTPGSGSSTT